MRRLGLLVVLLWGCSGGGDTDTDTDSPPVSTPCTEGDPLAVATTDGCVLGLDDWMYSEAFLGIPYAAPPVGALRWQRPVAGDGWEETLSADAFGEICVQAKDAALVGIEAGDGAEDCLTLNVLRPKGTTAGAGLPVLFFTHGGSHENGAGSQEYFMDDPRLAEEAVVVSHNYRLGDFGFMAHKALTAEDAAASGTSGSSGNQGLFDSLMALQWVVDNAEAFGGDPEQVMVFGESAGGLTTCALLASPLAKDLFSSALIQSIGCMWLSKPLKDTAGTGWLESGEDQGARLAAALGCSGSDEEVLQCMREASVGEVIAALPPEDAYGPSVDGVFLPDAAGTLFYFGDYNRVPIAAGVVADEGTMFTHHWGINTEAVLEESLRGWGASMGLSDLDNLVLLYSAEAYGGDTQRAFDQFYADLFFVCPTRFFLQNVAYYGPAYGYYYAHEPSWLPFYPALDGWGAYHSSEMIFVFGTSLDDLTEEERGFSERLGDTWRSMAQGTPQIPEFGEWPLFSEDLSASTDGGKWVQFTATETTLETGVRKERCDFFAEQWFGN